MKVNELIDSMSFSHRPQDGISVGFALQGGTAYMAVGFVRTGDYFNRKLARHILAQRIQSTIDGNTKVKYVAALSASPEKVDARTIVREFRKMFKPDPQCNDATFFEVHSLSSITGNGINVREQVSRDQSWNKILKMFTEAMKACGS